MPINVTMVIATVFAVIATILSLILIVPKSRFQKLPAFFRFVHDLFNFNFLIIEKILKTLYIFSTLYVIFLGFFMLFSGYQVGGFFSETQFHSLAGTGILVMLIGPFVIRIIYEFLMLTILLVKNVIEINKRAKGETDSPEFGTGGYSIKRPEFVNQFVQRQVNNTAQRYNTNPNPQQVAPERTYQYTAETTVAQPEYSFCTQCGTRYDKSQGNCPNCNN